MRLPRKKAARGLGVLVPLAALASLLTAVPAPASGQTLTEAQRALVARTGHLGKLRGVVLARGPASTGLDLRASRAAGDTGGPLAYQGGPVVHAHRTYAIFWRPASAPNGTNWSAGYKAAINRYLTDAAAAYGQPSNVYSVAAQYGDRTASTVFSSSFGGAYDDTAPYPVDPIPANNCSYLSAPTRPCVTDAQLQTELTSFITAHPELRTGLGTIYFVFLPQDVGTCANRGPDTPPNSCYLSAGGFCAYHGDYGPMDGTQTLYANMPYQNVSGCKLPSEPNGADSDDEIDVLSHEHIETVNDPLGSQCPTLGGCPAGELPAWFDANGNEIADKCTSPFFTAPTGPSSPYGPTIGGSGATAYNQLINGDHYLLQREYSNAAGGVGACVQRMVPAAFLAPATAPPGQPVTFDGSPSGTPDDPVASFAWDFGDQATGAGPSVIHTFAQPGTFAVTLSVTDAFGNANTTSKAINVAVQPPPPPPPPSTTPVPPPAPAAVIQTVNGIAYAKVKASRTRHGRLRARRNVRAPSQTRQVGTARVTLRDAQVTSVSVTLNSLGRRLLASQGRLTVTVRATATVAGRKMAVVHTLTLRRKSSHHRSRRHPPAKARRHAAK